MKLYRIAAAAPDWDELDLTGAAAKATGGRWNHIDVPVIYASSSIALAAMETIVHFGAGSFRLNRFVVEIDVPAPQFSRRITVHAPPPDAWDSIPESFKSKDFGSNWAHSKKSLVLDLPSVVIPLERNYVLNPAHRGIERVKAKNLGRFAYDARLMGT